MTDQPPAQSEPTVERPCDECGATEGWGSHLFGCSVARTTPPAQPVEDKARRLAPEELAWLHAHWTGRVGRVPEMGLRLLAALSDTEARLKRRAEGEATVLGQLAEVRKEKILLAEAVIEINRTPVYEERGKPESGISVAMVGAMRRAVEIAQALSLSTSHESEDG